MFVTGAYALVRSLKEYWYSVACSRSNGSPSYAVTSKSLVILKLAFDGVKRKSFGLTISTLSLYKAPNKISNDLSVPLLE